MNKLPAAFTGVLSAITVFQLTVIKADKGKPTNLKSAIKPQIGGRETIMRTITLAVTGAVATALAAALATCLALPAAAASRARAWKPTYGACEALAASRGIAINERRGTEYGPSPYRQFMVSCLAGKVEGKPVVAPRIAAEEQIPGKWDSCEQLALQRGVDVAERRGTEVRPSPWRQFMATCVAGKVH